MEGWLHEFKNIASLAEFVNKLKADRTALKEFSDDQEDGKDDQLNRVYENRRFNNLQIHQQDNIALLRYGFATDIQNCFQLYAHDTMEPEFMADLARSDIEPQLVPRGWYPWIERKVKTPKKKKNYDKDEEPTNNWDLCDILAA
uniref:Uncharacterized protein n=1 Tax=Romanomermis culicivorax TaxID=13658 RepID=A0A915JR35_ROMCU